MDGFFVNMNNEIISPIFSGIKWASNDYHKHRNVIFKNSLAYDWFYESSYTSSDVKFIIKEHDRSFYEYVYADPSSRNETYYLCYIDRNYRRIDYWGFNNLEQQCKVNVLSMVNIQLNGDD